MQQKRPARFSCRAVTQDGQPSIGMGPQCPKIGGIVASEPGRGGNGNRLGDFMRSDGMNWPAGHCATMAGIVEQPPGDVASV